MTCLNLPPSEPAAVLALLTLPTTLTPQALHELEHAVAETLARLGVGTIGADAVTPAGHRAAEAEYASWMPDPCALEVASWAAHLQSAIHRMPAAGASGPTSALR